MAILRSASSKIVLNAVRSIPYQRFRSGSITYAFNGCDREMEITFSHRFSTDARKQIDGKLVQILKSEIKSKELFLATNGPIPHRNWPFKLKDDLCEGNITLTRNFDGEKIEVVVVMPSNIPEDYGSDSDFFFIYDNDYEDTNYDGNYDNDESKSLTLKVTISKENGKILEFEVFASYHEIKINSILIKEPEGEPSHPLQIFGPHVVKEEGALKISLREFLKIRGIKKNIYGSLYEYMFKKSRNDNVAALKKLRKFIKEK